MHPTAISAAICVVRAYQGVLGKPPFSRVYFLLQPARVCEVCFFQLTSLVHPPGRVPTKDAHGLVGLSVRSTKHPSHLFSQLCPHLHTCAHALNIPACTFTVASGFSAQPSNPPFTGPESHLIKCQSGCVTHPLRTHQQCLIGYRTKSRPSSMTQEALLSWLLVTCFPFSPPALFPTLIPLP